VLTSLKLTVASLSVLIVLVLACTLAQVQLGTLGAVTVYIHSFWVWWKPAGWEQSIPLMPGGALVGAVLVVNLVAAQIKRMELSWKKSGMWVTHAGLVLLIAGEFVTGAFQRETQMTIEEGQTVNYVESPRELELSLIDGTDPGHDEVYGVPEALLKAGSTVAIPGTPLSLKVKHFVRNADLADRAPAEPPTMADMGVGPHVKVTEVPAITRDDEMNRTVVFVEPIADGKSYGTWLVSNAVSVPQEFTHQGRVYSLGMRQRREYLAYDVTLRDFRHDVYPGTQIPKNFASLVHLSTPDKKEDRDVLIYMNQPMRFGGKAFYQSSFGKEDTLSVLQVVDNPGWLLPYISCTLVSLGLLIHFAISLRRTQKGRSLAVEGSP